VDQNHKKLNKSRDPNSIYFWDIFQKKIGGKLEGLGVKFMATLALMPYDRGVDLLGCPIFTNLTKVSVIAEQIRGEADEHEEHDTNTCTQIRLYSLAQTTNSIELQEKDQKVESLAKDRQTQIEFQSVKDQLRIELQGKRFPN
jgi:hypothetical protein